MSLFFVVGGLTVVDHVVQPGREPHGVWVFGVGFEAVDRGEDVVDVVEVVVKAGWFAVTLAKIGEALFGERGIHAPGTSQCFPLACAGVVHEMVRL